MIWINPDAMRSHILIYCMKFSRNMKWSNQWYSHTWYIANPIVRQSAPILFCALLFFCIRATITVHLSSSSSGCSNVIRYCGLCQKVSARYTYIYLIQFRFLWNWSRSFIRYICIFHLNNFYNHPLLHRAPILPQIHSFPSVSSRRQYRL